MSRRFASLGATTVALLSVAMAAGGVWSVLAGRAFPEVADIAPWATRLASYPTGLAITAVGWLLVTRLAGVAYGWVWLGLGFAQTLQMACRDYGTLLLSAGGTGPLSPETLGMLADYGFLASLWLLGLVLLLFPDGRLPSPRWRLVVWATTVSVALLGAPMWALPGESGTIPVAWAGVLPPVPPVIGLGGDVLLYALFLGIPLGVLSVVLRYRRASGIERQQIKWLALAALLTLPFWVFDMPGILDPIFEAVTGVFLPVAMAVAIFRHRLYDIDRLLSRTVSYAALVAMLALVYLGGVTALGAVMGQDSPLTVAGATLAAAALFTPIRTRVQRWMDRRFDRARYDASQVVDGFAARMRHEVDLDGLTGDLRGVVDRTLRPASLAIWVRGDAG